MVRNKRIRSEAVAHSLKLLILLVIFVLLYFLRHADSDSDRHAALHMLTVTPKGVCANGVMGMVLQ